MTCLRKNTGNRERSWIVVAALAGLLRPIESPNQPRSLRASLSIGALSLWLDDSAIRAFCNAKTLCGRSSGSSIGRRRGAGGGAGGGGPAGGRGGGAGRAGT